MDEIKLSLKTKIMRAAVSRYIKSMVRKKTGAKVNILINDLDMVTADGQVKLRFDVSAVMDQQELIRIIDSVSKDVKL